MTGFSLPFVGALDRPACLRLVGAACVLWAIVLVPVWFMAIPTSPQVRHCTCKEAAAAQAELMELQENVTQSDLQRALGAEPGANSSLGPLERVVERQRQLILKQAAAILDLRQADRAKELGLSKREVRQMKYTTFEVWEDRPRLWEQRTFRKHAAFGFVAFGAYRLSPGMVVVDGLGHFLSRGERRIQECAWVSDNGHRVQGTLTLETMEEHHRFLYEPLILNCTYPSQDHRREGSLYHSSMGGHLEVKLDQEVWYPYTEDQGYEIHAEDSDGPFRYSGLFCGPPMFGDFSIPSLTQWVAYHRYHAGIEHFILYDTGSVTEEFQKALNPLVAEGLVTVQDFKEGLQYDVWAQNQALAMHDCLHRSRDIARWVYFHDLDEYLQVMPPQTLPSILKQYEDKPYITHGCYIFSIDNCEESSVWDPQHDKFAIELLLFRLERPYCTNGDYEPNMCLDYHGHRKLILNPRKVTRAYVHVPDIPNTGGVDLPMTEMRHAHYRGIFHPRRPCSQPADTRPDLVKDTTVAEIAAKARGCDKGGFMDQEKCRPSLPVKSP